MAQDTETFAPGAQVAAANWSRNAEPHDDDRARRLGRRRQRGLLRQCRLLHGASELLPPCTLPPFAELWNGTTWAEVPLPTIQRSDGANVQLAGVSCVTDAVLHRGGQRRDQQGVGGAAHRAVERFGLDGGAGQRVRHHGTRRRLLPHRQLLHGGRARSARTPARSSSSNGTGRRGFRPRWRTRHAPPMRSPSASPARRPPSAWSSAPPGPRSQEAPMSPRGTARPGRRSRVTNSFNRRHPAVRVVRRGVVLHGRRHGRSEREPRDRRLVERSSRLDTGHRPDPPGAGQALRDQLHQHLGLHRGGRLRLLRRGRQTPWSSPGTAWPGVSPPTPPTRPARPQTYFTDVACLPNWACVAVGTFQDSNGDMLPFDASAPIARPGYRFVAADGGVFGYGAPFFGSLGGTRLNAPIVGHGHHAGRRRLLPGGLGRRGVRLRERTVLRLASAACT